MRSGNATSPPEGACYSRRRETYDGRHDSTPVSDHKRFTAYRPGADDFNPGFHLEVGESKRDGYSLGATRRRSPRLTSRPELHTERASVDHETVGTPGPRDTEGPVA